MTSIPKLIPKKELDRLRKQVARLQREVDEEAKAEPRSKEDIDETIKKAWTQPTGFGSKASLLRDARMLDPKITTQDVDSWWNANRERKQKLHGYNSYVPPGPKYEYQVDLFYYNYKQLHNENRHKRDKIGAYGLLAVDPFTKYIHVVPLNRKLATGWVKALQAIFEKMGKPKVVYTDPDASMDSKVMRTFLAKEEVDWIRTTEHANNAERAIRTIKHGLDERLSNLGEDQWGYWWNYLPDVLKKYNEVEKSSVTRISAKDANKPENEADVRTQLVIHKKHDRKYPELGIGDRVRVFKKKKTFDKERVSNWEDGYRTVQAITESHGQKFYKVDNVDKPFIRSNLYKLPVEQQKVKKAGEYNEGDEGIRANV